ncbi:ABC transporter substrate-binding protein [Nonomuraea sp. KC401]|uniref:ABC transporter substrate-binding protein n=1 Tax=unclassified Nonomuraea TaxID=2593643 RepID=UPI0010FD15E8|nr:MULTISPECIES: ABC transporter substrate-binding protein [unclassified Nonomuraea]NBE92701.1 ABC transporter substrate-binding protein [Nonomuraea sp. K271]TLF78951.1 ABC transporter substrate-binding protein [Nonomuraea sp. KC401]
MATVPRRILAAVGAATLLGVSACGGTAPPSAAAPSAPSASGQGPWTWTDDRGKHISLPARPRRVVAQSGAAAALWDFGVRPVAVFGPHRLKGGGRDPEVGEVDISTVESIGNVWGEFNVEKYASLRPDLLVAGMYQKDTLWYVPEESVKVVDQIAPTVGVQLSGKPLVEIIETYGRLAAALGADPEAAPVAEAKKRFDAAGEALRTLAAARPDLKVMIVTGTPDNLYVAYLPDHPDIKYWGELGLNIVSPDRPTESEGGFWEVLSWENADKYDADVILVDARAQSMKIDEMAGKPTWAKLPAVKAGQLYPWHAAERYSHLGYAKVMEELKANLDKSRDDVVR